MADEVELATFTVALQSAAPSTAAASRGMTLSPATPDEARQAFGVEVREALPGGLYRTGMVRGEGSQPVLIADYASEAPEGRASVSFILIPASVYPAGRDGRKRYAVLADSLERKTIAGRTAALARRDSRGAMQPGNLTVVWEKDALLALAVVHGMTVASFEAIMMALD